MSRDEKASILNLSFLVDREKQLPQGDNENIIFADEAPEEMSTEEMSTRRTPISSVGEVRENNDTNSYKNSLHSPSTNSFLTMAPAVDPSTSLRLSRNTTSNPTTSRPGAMRIQGPDAYAGVSISTNQDTISSLTSSRLIQAELVQSRPPSVVQPITAEATRLSPNRRRIYYLVAGLMLLVVVLATVIAILLTRNSGTGSTTGANSGLNDAVNDQPQDTKSMAPSVSPSDDSQPSPAETSSPFPTNAASLPSSVASESPIPSSSGLLPSEPSQLSSKPISPVTIGLPIAPVEIMPVSALLDSVPPSGSAQPTQEIDPNENQPSSGRPTFGTTTSAPVVPPATFIAPTPGPTLSTPQPPPSSMPTSSMPTIGSPLESVLTSVAPTQDDPTNAPSSTANPILPPPITPPTHAPSPSPTARQSSDPVIPPTSPPTHPPSTSPTPPPITQPTLPPTLPPTHPPSLSPTTPPITQPTFAPTPPPTLPPSARPTNPPIIDPTLPPTNQPTTQMPSVRPVFDPTLAPTPPPTPLPTPQPTRATDAPTVEILEPWQQVGQPIVGVNRNDRYGAALALSNSGNTVVVGVKAGSTGLSGSVDIYRYNGNSNQWNPLGNAISGDFADLFGDHVAISADGNMVAGSSLTFQGSRGLVRVFQYNEEGTWIQLGSDLLGEVSSDRWGTSVAMSLDGLTVAAGSPANDANGNASGSVRVFIYDGSNDWIQLGETLLGEEALSAFGTAVALSGNGRVMVVSAPRFDGDSELNQPGLVRVFQYNSATNIWDRKGQGIFGEGNGDQSGTSVAMNADGNIIAIGSQENDNSFNRAGHVRAFEYNISSGSWNLLGADIRGEARSDLSGASISLSSQGTILAVGARGNDEVGNSAGHIRVFQYRSNKWNQYGADIEATRAEDEFGTAVSLSGSGNILAGGSPFHELVNAEENNIGEVRMFAFS